MNAVETKKSMEGLAFPVIRSRYAGPTDTRGSRYIATFRRGNDETYRATVSYDDALTPTQNARAAAAAAWAKYVKRFGEDHPTIPELEPRVFVSGDLDASSYAFVVVPDYFFTS